MIRSISTLSTQHLSVRMSSVKIAIVGGGGYVGQALCVALAAKGYKLLVVDFVECPESISAIKGDVTYEQASIVHGQQIRLLFGEFEPAVVIHLASMGMSGSSMLSPECHPVNVQGTASLINICLEKNIPNLIYTSSYNVVFGGNEIVNGDETLPYYPLDKHNDKYGPTKAMAEELVIKANGTPMRNKEQLRTASIRPAGIYGDNEQRHMPRIVKNIDNGLFLFTIGKATVDWVEITNLVQAFELLVEKMLALENARSVPAGQIYSISDGTPVENFEFLRPLTLARGKKFPTLVLPSFLMLCVAYFFERLWFHSNVLEVPIEPFMVRAEVLKVSVTHYFSIDKARRELGYRPRITTAQGAENLAKRYAASLTNEDYFELPALAWWIGVIGGMILTYMVAYCRPESFLMKNAFLQAVNSLAMAIFRSSTNMRWLFWSAVGAHAVEAAYAVYYARQHGCTNTWFAWGLQTLILGYPSQQCLYRRTALLKTRSLQDSKKKD